MLRLPEVHSFLCYYYTTVTTFIRYFNKKMQLFKKKTHRPLSWAGPVWLPETVVKDNAFA